MWLPFSVLPWKYPVKTKGCTHHSYRFGGQHFLCCQGCTVGDVSHDVPQGNHGWSGRVAVKGDVSAIEKSPSFHCTSQLFLGFASSSHEARRCAWGADSLHLCPAWKRVWVLMLLFTRERTSNDVTFISKWLGLEALALLLLVKPTCSDWLFWEKFGERERQWKYQLMVLSWVCGGFKMLWKVW